MQTRVDKRIPMKYYPIFLDVNAKKCLVVGGGPVGARKAAILEKCGADVKVVSDRFSTHFDKLKASTIRLEKKGYDKQDVKGMFLVLAATNNRGLNQEIKKDASRLNIFCNIADAPSDSDFLLPSVVDRGDLVIAVSTTGASPAMAKKIRQTLEQDFGPEYTRLLMLLKQIRKKLLSSGHAPQDHKIMFTTLIEKGILELIEADDDMKIDAVLNDIFGKGYTYQDLISPRSNG